MGPIGLMCCTLRKGAKGCALSLQLRPVAFIGSFAANVCAPVNLGDFATVKCMQMASVPQ